MFHDAPAHRQQAHNPPSGLFRMLLGTTRTLLGAPTTSPPFEPATAGWELAPRAYELGPDLRVWALPVGRAAIRRRHLELEPSLATANSGLRMLALLSDPRLTAWLPVYAWLVEAGGERLLIDTGESPGAGTPEYLANTDFLTRRLYHRLGCFQNDAATGLVEQLARAGTAIDQIDKVVFTHLHSDHVGNAELIGFRDIILDQRELESAKGTGRFPQKLPATSSIEPVKWIDNAGNPGFDQSASVLRDRRIQLLPTPGHTPGHLSVLIEADRSLVLIAGDLAFSEAQVQSGGVSAIVEDERRTAETVERVRRLISERPTVCLFTHDPGNLARLDRMQA